MSYSSSLFSPSPSTTTGTAPWIAARSSLSASLALGLPPPLRRVYNYPMSNDSDEYLAPAERHVWEGERRVAEQQARIKQLVAARRDTEDAEKFLRTLEQSLALMRQHLQLEVTHSNYRPRE